MVLAARTKRPMDSTSVFAGHIARNDQSTATKVDSALKAAERLLSTIRMGRSDGKHPLTSLSLPIYLSSSLYSDSSDSTLSSSFSSLSVSIDHRKAQKRQQFLEEQAEARRKQREEEAKLHEEWLNQQKAIREQHAKLLRESETLRQAKVVEMIIGFGEKRKESGRLREAERERLREEDRKRKENLKKEREKREKIERLELRRRELQLEAQNRLREQKEREEREERERKERERRIKEGYDFNDLVNINKTYFHHSLYSSSAGRGGSITSQTTALTVATDLNLSSFSSSSSVSHSSGYSSPEFLLTPTAGSSSSFDRGTNSRSSSIDVLIDLKERTRSQSSEDGPPETNDYQLDYKPLLDGIPPPIDRQYMLEAERDDFYEGAIVYVRYQKSRVERVEWPIIYYRVYNPHVYRWDDLTREACVPVLEDGVKYTLGPEKHRNYLYTKANFTVEPESRTRSLERKSQLTHEEDFGPLQHFDKPTKPKRKRIKKKKIKSSQAPTTEGGEVSDGSEGSDGDGSGVELPSTEQWEVPI